MGGGGGGGGVGRVTNISLQGDRVLRSLTRTRTGKERESIISCLTCTLFLSVRRTINRKTKFSRLVRCTKINETRFTYHTLLNKVWTIQS